MTCDNGLVPGSELLPGGATAEPLAFPIATWSEARVETAAIRAISAARAGMWNTAIESAAVSIALGADRLPSRPTPGRSHALGHLAQALSIIGAHELADRAARTAVAAAIGQPTRASARLQVVRVRLACALSHELDGDHAAAGSQFAAARLAVTQLRRRCDLDPGRAHLACSAIAAAAIALHRPHPAHLPMLAATRPATADDAATVAIATWRCLPHDRHAPSSGEPSVPDITELDHPILRVALRRESATHRHATTRATTSAEPTAAPDSGEVAALHAEVDAEMRARYGAHTTALHYAVAYHRLRIAHDHAVHQAMHDPLTGLPNRRAIDHQLGAIATVHVCEPAALAMIDLDGFKTVNDRLSHSAGDAVLRAIADCLRQNLREHDLLARTGGDEFIAYLPATTLHDAAMTLRRTAAVAQLPAAHGVTASIGLADLLPGADPAAAMASADAAMYQAKKAGGSTVIIADFRRPEISDEMRAVAALGRLITPRAGPSHPARQL